jgi:hypothetical protein
MGLRLRKSILLASGTSASPLASGISSAEILHRQPRCSLPSPLRPVIPSLLTTPSAIIDPVGALPRVAPRAERPAAVSWANRHRLLTGFLVLLAGFGLMHLLFVGGEQRGPLLPLLVPATPIGVAADKLAVPEVTKRASTQPHGTTAAGGSGADHPLPPQRPSGI